MHTLPHLTAERLAALVDEPPTAMERAHLDGCAPCRGEADAHRSLLALAAGERARIGPPAAPWEAIAAGLRAEGVLHPSLHSGQAAPPVAAPLSLVRGGADVGTAPVATSRAAEAPEPTHVTFRVPRRAMRAAAALLLVAGGMAAGRLTAPGAARVVQPPVPGTPLTGVSQTAPVSFASRTEAAAALQSAEQQYQRAAEFLAITDSVSAPAAEASAADVYRARLAAFDGVVAATQQALYAAPADPVINRYYLATNAAREVALKQLSLVAPAGTQINRY